MPLVIPIAAVPSQTIFCVLGNQNCQIAVYQKTQGVFVDLNSNGVDAFIASLGLNAVPLDSANSYSGFSGNLYFIDTQGSDDPQYTGFNTRWVLIYLTAAEIIAFEQSGTVAVPTQFMTLSATLSVTSSAPGNFSIAHGLDAVPFLIEILPTSGGAIWGQTGFADATNINLVASDTGVTAKVLVYTTLLASVTPVIAVPATTLLVTSSAPGNFSVPHGLGVVPSLIEILLTAGGVIWAQTPTFDATNVYLVASDTGLTATISVYPPVLSALNIEAPAVSRLVLSTGWGPLAFEHGLSAAPSRIEILMISGGVIWAQTPAFDTTNVYLQSSDDAVLAIVSVYP